MLKYVFENTVTKNEPAVKKNNVILICLQCCYQTVARHLAAAIYIYFP
jgi:hypothetical protein